MKGKLLLRTYDVKLVGGAMKVEIVGAGAVGLLLGSFLLSKGLEVTFVVRNEQQLREINEKGIAVQSIEGDMKYFKNAKASLTLGNERSLVIVSTKYEHLTSIWPMLLEHRDIGEFLFVQNGLAHYEEGINQPLSNVSFGSAQFGAQKLNAVTVAHRGIGVLKLAAGNGACMLSRELLALGDETMPMEWQEDAFSMLFEKALLNCFVNPLTAVLQVPNGQLITNGHAYTLLEQLYEELMTAFPTYRERFPFEMVRSLCERTATNTSSMLADRLAGRRTEVETIVGEVIRIAKRGGYEVPVLTTLYYLVKALDSIGD